MKNYILLATVCSLIALGACGGQPTSDTASGTPAPTPFVEPTKVVVTLKPGEVPFDGFSGVKTTAKPGENILSFDISKMEEIATNPKEASALFYNRKMITPGDIESEIEDFGGKKIKIPNAYIIALPRGQKAKVGDIVLTWWQSGGGMFRGYVVEASNPAEPTVRYLNMLNSPDKQDKLKPDSFVVIREPFQPGNVVAVKNEGHLDGVKIIRVEGDKILTEGFARRMRVFNKTDATPVPLNPKVKAGDKVKALFFAYYEDASIVSVDEKLGKVTVKKDGSNEEKTLDFGDILK